MTAPADPVLTLQRLRDVAAGLEHQAVAAGAVGEADLDQHRPGVPPETERDPAAWLQYHGWLSGQLALAMATPRTGRALAQVKVDAAADAPVPIALASGRVVHVQPKSAHALLIMRGLDSEWRLLGPEVAAVLDGSAAAPAAVHAAIWASILEARSLRLWLWAATEGIKLPFDESAAELTPPDWTAEATARDLAAVWEAHLQINHEDLAILVRAFPRASGAAPDRTMEDVIAGIAQERGRPTRAVYCLESVRGLYLQALAAAQVAEDAKRRSTPARGAA